MLFRSYLTLCLVGLSLSTPATLWAGEKAEPSHDGRTLTQWLAVLKSRDGAARLSAVAAVRQIPHPPKHAISALLIALEDDEDARVRTQAAEALGMLRVEPELTVPSLITALKDENKEVRSNAAYALSRFARKAKLAVPALVKALKDPDERVQYCAAFALGTMGAEAKAAVTPLCEALKSPCEPLRLNACLTLGEIGADAPTVIPLLTRALEDPSDAVKEASAKALTHFGEDGTDILIHVFERGAPKVRTAAVAAFGQQHRHYSKAESRKIIPVLVKALQNEDIAAREASAYAIGRFGAEGMQALIDELNTSKVAEGRAQAAWALGVNRLGGKEAEPSLIRATKDPEAPVRAKAVWALGELGMTNKALVPAVLDVMKDADSRVRSKAALALGRFRLDAKEANQVVAVLFGALEDKDESVRRAAGTSLQRLVDAALSKAGVR